MGDMQIKLAGNHLIDGKNASLDCNKQPDATHTNQVSVGGKTGYCTDEAKQTYDSYGPEAWRRGPDSMLDQLKQMVSPR